MDRPDIKTHFPKDTNVTDVVKTALNNPWYTYAGSLDNYIDYLLEKIESSSRIIQADERKRLLEDYTNWLWHQHNDLTNSNNNKAALESYLSSNGG